MPHKATPEDYDRFVTELEKLIPGYGLVTALDKRTRDWSTTKKAEIATGLLALAAVLNA